MKIRTMAISVLLAALLVVAAQSQNWVHEKYRNAIDGDYQTQAVISTDKTVVLIVSNNGESIFAALFAEYGFCARDDSGEIYA